jgi:hypothetical protein
MSSRSISVAAVAALGIGCVSIGALAAHAGNRGVIGDRPWYNPDYSTGSYSPSYSTSIHNPGYSIDYSNIQYSGYASGYHTSSNRTAGSCAQRFKSYDRGSGTYLGHDGQRHPCP